MLIRVRLLQLLVEHDITGPSFGEIVATRYALPQELLCGRPHNDPLVVVRWSDKTDLLVVFRIINGIVLNEDKEMGQIHDCVLQVEPIYMQTVGNLNKLDDFEENGEVYSMLYDIVTDFDQKKTFPIGAPLK